MPMVLTERRGGVAVLTLNNPTQYNALGGSLLPELNAALQSALSDRAVRAILLTGAGKDFAPARSLAAMRSMPVSALRRSCAIRSIR